MREAPEMTALARAVELGGGLASLRAGNALELRRGPHVLEVAREAPRGRGGPDALRVTLTRLAFGRAFSRTEALFHVRAGRWEPQYWSFAGRESLVIGAAGPGARPGGPEAPALAAAALGLDERLAALGFAATDEPEPLRLPALSRVLRRGGGVRKLRRSGPLRVEREAGALEIERVDSNGNAHLLRVALVRSRDGRPARCPEAYFTLSGGEYLPEYWRDERRELLVFERVRDYLHVLDLERRRRIAGLAREWDAEILRMGFADAGAAPGPAVVRRAREGARP